MALAPMYDVTDAAFRRIIAKYGKPDVMWTEFVSTDGLSSPVGREKLDHHLWFDQSEQPVVAQIFGTKPEHYTQTAELVANKGFAGIDINMGCPDKNIIKGGSCAALIRTPELAQDLIRAAKKGAGNLPVSVKIRIGDSAITWKPWLTALLEAEPAAITIHLRTRKEMSKVPAHWELMPEIMQFVQEQRTGSYRPVILGNGDVATVDEAHEKVAATGCDGVMIGRGIFGNPWLFSGRTDEPNQNEKLRVLLEHAELYQELFTGIKPFEIMKRHFKAYVHGFDGAAELRAQLYECNNAADVRAIIAPLLD